VLRPGCGAVSQGATPSLPLARSRWLLLVRTQKRDRPATLPRNGRAGCRRRPGRRPRQAIAFEEGGISLSASPLSLDDTERDQLVGGLVLQALHRLGINNAIARVGVTADQQLQQLALFAVLGPLQLRFEPPQHILDHGTKEIF